MPTYTENLNLYKWAATDTKQTTITEMSNNADKMDAAVKAHDDYLRQNAINVKLPPYNAKGNGVDDDAIVINQAITDAKAAGGGTVYLPAGLYTIKSSIVLKEGVNIVGAAMVYRETGGTIIKAIGDINAITTGLTIADTTDCRSVILSNFVVSGDESIPAASKVGYGLSGAHLRYNVVLFQVGFKYFLDGIHLSEAWTIDLYKVLCNYNGRHGIYFDEGANRVNLYGCEMNRNGQNGFHIPASGTKENQGILVQGCLMELNGSQGLQINFTQNVSLRDNYFEANVGGYAYLRGESGFENYAVTVEGNRFYAYSGAPSTTYGVQISDFTHNVVISCNHFRDLPIAIRYVSNPNQNIVIMPNSFINCASKLTKIGTSNTAAVVGNAL